MQNFPRFKNLKYFIENYNIFYYFSAGMGTGAHKAASACDSKGQAKACVQQRHDRKLPHGRIPIPAVYGRSCLTSMR